MSEPIDLRANAGAARRARILDEAEALFAAHGYHGIALARIATAAGLGNAGLIHHFPTKAKLYRVVLERVADDLDGRLERALEGVHGAAAGLRAFLHVQMEWMVERPLAFRLIQRELIDNRERMQSARTLPLAGFVTTGVGIVRHAQSAGLLPPGPAELRLNLLIGTLTYAAMVRPTFRQIIPASSNGSLLADDRIWLEAVVDDLLADSVEPRAKNR